MNKIAVSYDVDGSGSTYLFDKNGNSEALVPPEGLQVVNNYVDFIPWRTGRFARTYILGGHTANVMLAEDDAFLRMFIRAPSCPLVNSAVPVQNQCGVTVGPAGGLTGSVRVALRWFDSVHNRRSPLSSASPAIVLANQGVNVYSAPLLPDPYDEGVDTLEIWASVDGGLFRLWDSIDIGVANFSTTETSTGIAYSTTLIEMPLVKFGDIANDRGFYAGNPDNPELVYISEVDNPEEYSGVTIPTRNREPVIGIKNIGGTIVVQCVGATYYIQGFGPSDFTMRVMQPKIGGFGQKAIFKLNDIALIPSQLSWYVCNGTSLVPLGTGEWARTWRNTVSDPTRRACYEDGFGSVDLVSGVVKFLPRTPTSSENQFPSIVMFPNTATAVNNYWVLDTAKIDGQRADLSFDQHNGGAHTAMAMLYDPDADIGELYVGTADGDILLENQIRNIDRRTVAAVETKIPIECMVHTFHGRIAPVFQNEDGSQVTDIMANFQSDNWDTVLSVFAGNELAWQAGASGSPTPTGTEVFQVPAGWEQPASYPATLNTLVPRDRFWQSSLSNGGGSSVSLRLSMTQDDDALPFEDTTTTLQRSEFLFNGWGYIAQAGLDKRPIGVYIAPSGGATEGRHGEAVLSSRPARAA